MRTRTDESDITVTVMDAEDTAGTSSLGDNLRPKPVQDDDSWPGTRWLFRWLRVIVVPERGSDQTTVRGLRLVTYLLLGAGLVFAKITPERIVPISIQVVVVLGVLTFSSVGSWMLRWPDVRTNVIGWIFCSAGAVGAFVYAASTYSNLAIGHQWAGGVMAGWVADMLFLPSIAVFASLLLASISTGHLWESSDARRTVLCGVSGAAFLLIGMALEPQLVSYPGGIEAPLATAPYADTWGWAVLLGLVSLLTSIVIGFNSARKNDSMLNASKWYGYGGAFALFALVPYLGITFAEWQATPSARSAARAGVATLALIAVAAIPATLDEPWRPARMKRLVRGVVIAGIAAALHEFLVHSAVDRVVSASEPDPELGNQALFTYELVLIAAAVLFEPFALAFDALFEHLAYWRSPAHDLLEEGLDDLRASRVRLNRAMARASRLAKIGSSRAQQGTSRRTARQERAAGEIGAVYADIRKEHAEAGTLLDRIEAEMPQLLASTT